MSFAPGIDASGLIQGSSYLSRPADEYVNNANVEAIWAEKTGRYADVHYNLLCSAKPSMLKMSKYDNRIYDSFKKQFPDFAVKVVTEHSLKSPENKEKWRKFCEEMKDIEDYNFGTLLRLDCEKEYDEVNTIFVTRIQFQAIEIARNRLGLNDIIWEQNCVKKDALKNNSNAS